jgi:hypothetical protein
LRTYATTRSSRRAREVSGRVWTHEERALKEAVVNEAVVKEAVADEAVGRRRLIKLEWSFSKDL